MMAVMFGGARGIGRLSVAWSCALWAMGCMHTQGATEAQLMRRAQLDMGCAAAQLRVYELDARTRVVDGCGRRVIYVASCEPARGKVACTWLANSPHPAPYVVRYSYRADRPTQPAGPQSPSSQSPSPEPSPRPSRAVDLRSAFEPQARTQDAAPKPAPIRADRGQLHVASTGGFCVVTVNGVPHGPTPVGAIEVKPGVVDVSCRYAGAIQRKQVSIRAGETKRMSFTLSPR